MTGAGTAVTCCNGHGAQEVLQTKNNNLYGTYFELGCGCRNTPAQELTGSTVSGTTYIAGSPITQWAPADRRQNVP